MIAFCCTHCEPWEMISDIILQAAGKLGADVFWGFLIEFCLLLVNNILSMKRIKLDFLCSGLINVSIFVNFDFLDFLIFTLVEGGGIFSRRC